MLTAVTLPVESPPLERNALVSHSAVMSDVVVGTVVMAEIVNHSVGWPTTDLAEQVFTNRPRRLPSPDLSYSVRMKQLWRMVLAALVLGVLATSCGDDDDASTTLESGESQDAATSDPTEGDGTNEAAGTEPNAEEAPDEGDAAEEREPEQEQEPGDTDEAIAGPAGQGNATLELDNGDTFEFSILCSLQPQEAAGSEILFTVVSYDDPYNLDITQFGAESFGGAANISVYDSTTYDTVWESNSMFGNDIELSLDANTVTGEGTFFEGDAVTGDGVQGRVEANCS